MPEDGCDSSRGGFNCNVCPVVGYLCNSDSREERLTIFKEELKRRENMTDMPELKAGMIVEVKSGRNFMILPNRDGKLLMYSIEGTDHFTDDIIKIYDLPHTNYRPFFTRENDTDKVEHTKLLWSKQSPNEKKILELESTVKEALKQIEELKGEKA